jgi:hypothetical protein
MRTPTFDSKALRRHLRRHKIATMSELKQALGTGTDLTVLRKLKTLGYRSSYTHRGAYYTLTEVPRFDDEGLWSHEGVWFSRHGTLRDTAQRFVERAAQGFFADELADALHAEVHDVLRRLTREGGVSRTEVDGRYLYTAADSHQHRRQLRMRRTTGAVPVAAEARAVQVSPDELQAAVLLFYSLLDEQQRRVYAGLESLRLGHGGDTVLADFLALDPRTVARGRQQLLDRDVAAAGRTRRPGGGRVPTEKKRPKSSPSSKTS